MVRRPSHDHPVTGSHPYSPYFVSHISDVEHSPSETRVPVVLIRESLQSSPSYKKALYL
jgi:hypothetical protein